MDPNLYYSESETKAFFKLKNTNGFTSTATSSATSNGNSYYPELEKLQLNVDAISRDIAINLVTNIPKETIITETETKTTNIITNPIESVIDAVLNVYGYNEI